MSYFFGLSGVSLILVTPGGRWTAGHYHIFCTSCECFFFRSGNLNHQRPWVLKWLMIFQITTFDKIRCILLTGKHLVCTKVCTKGPRWPTAQCAHCAIWVPSNWTSWRDIFQHLCLDTPLTSRNQRSTPIVTAKGSIAWPSSLTSNHCIGNYSSFRNHWKFI